MLSIESCELSPTQTCGRLKSTVALQESLHQISQSVSHRVSLFTGHFKMLFLWASFHLWTLLVTESTKVRLLKRARLGLHFMTATGSSVTSKSQKKLKRLAVCPSLCTVCRILSSIRNTHSFPMNISRPVQNRYYPVKRNNLSKMHKNVSQFEAKEKARKITKLQNDY